MDKATVEKEMARGAVKKKKRGSVRNKDRLAAFANDSGRGGADWGSASCAWLQGVIVGITALGGAVIFGLSRDQGAYAVTLLLDDSRETLWFNGDVDLDECLEGVVDTLDGMG